MSRFAIQFEGDSFSRNPNPAYTKICTRSSLTSWCQSAPMSFMPTASGYSQRLPFGPRLFDERLSSMRFEYTPNSAQR